MRLAGFAGTRVVVAYPRRSDWQRLIPRERLRQDLMKPRGTDSTARVLPSLVRRAAAASGAAIWLVPEYLVLAHRRPRGDGPPLMLTESLVAFAGEPPPVVGALGDARVTMTGEQSFVKFPLSRSQQGALAQEVEKTLVARTTSFGPLTLPWARSDDWHGIPYSVFPLVPQPRRIARSETSTAVLAAIEAREVERTAPIRDTALWERLFSERGVEDVREIGAEALRDAVLDRCADVLVPVGPTHGDLHERNVLPRGRQRPLLIDWNRFEACNPLVLDAANAAVWMQRKHARVSLGAALSAFADGDLDDEITRRARQLLGGLTPLQAATLLLLDRIVSYGPPRARHRPWKLEPLQTAAVTMSRRLDEWPS